MAGAVELLVVFWKAWGIQTLVLLSFTLQVTLLLLADLRRRKDSGMLKGVLWSAYVLADTTAIYALGHMSVASRPAEHRLMALWAPLLLVHLGGQDNLTAYAVEDNRLWLRHLQIFGVQVVAAAFVVYESSILGSRSWLRRATVLVFVVGVLRYGERVWALKCASSCTSSRHSATKYKDFRSLPQPPDFAPPSPRTAQEHRENLLLRAYTLLEIPKQLFSGPTRDVEIVVDCHYGAEDMSRVVEMQLSMTYDLLYTKAAVVHTWYGLCIRVISTMATVTAFLLFHTSRSGEDGRSYSRVDVAATYVLLAGAVVLEITSVLRAMLSTWTYVFLLRRRWVRLGRAIQSLPQLLRKKRHWSGSMGQLNLSVLCPRGRGRIRLSSRVARWIGRQDWWDSMACPWSIPASSAVVQMVAEMAERRIEKADELEITNSQGREALRRGGVYEELRWSVDMELDGSILVWHIATNVYLRWYNEKDPELHPLLAQPTEALSNYMFFVLAARPYLLPYPVSRQNYVQLCHDMFTYIKNRPTADLPWDEHKEGTGPAMPGFSGLDGSSAFLTGPQLGAKLIGKVVEGDIQDGDMLKVISEVWVEMLCYAAYRCNETSHSKHLSNGGDIMTAVALQLLYSGTRMSRQLRTTQLRPGKRYELDTDHREEV